MGRNRIEIWESYSINPNWIKLLVAKLPILRIYDQDVNTLLKEAVT